jgi:hypothetical protein
LFERPDHLCLRVPALRHTFFRFRTNHTQLCADKGAGQGASEDTANLHPKVEKPAVKTRDFNRIRQSSTTGDDRFNSNHLESTKILQISMACRIWFGTSGVGGSNPLSPTKG